MNYLYGLLSYISFKLKMPTFARGFFKKSLSMKPGVKEPAISLYVKRAHHASLLEVIEHSNLNNQYQAYLKAVVHRHERNYKRAYEYIAHDKSPDILNLKIRLLYDLKNFKDIVKLSKEGNDVLPHLAEKQQRTLIKHLISRNNFEDAEMLFKNTSAKNESLFKDLEEAKNDIFYKYNWRQYKSNFLDLNDEEFTSVGEYKLYIDEQSRQIQSLGYVLLINQFFDQFGNEHILNEKYVPYVNAKPALLRYINPAAIYKLDFKYMDESNEAIQLQNVLNQLYIGGRSQKLVNDVIKKLHKTQLTQQHIFSLRRLVIEGRLDLSDDNVRKLFIEGKKLEPVFYNFNLFTDDEIKDEVDTFVHEEFDQKQKKRIYNMVIRQLSSLDDTSRLPVNLMQYMVNNNAKTAHTFILAKQYYLDGLPDLTAELFKDMPKDRRLKMHVQLAKFLFNIKSFKQSLCEAEKAYEIKPNNTDVLRGLIRAHHTLGNISKRYEYLIKLRRVNPARIFPGEFQMASQEYKLLNDSWELPERLSKLQITNEMESGKVLYVLNKALPAINGYTIRSNEIIKRIKDNGYKPIVMTRLGWSPVHEGHEIPKEHINSVQTYYIDKSDKYMTNKTPILDYFDAYANEVNAIIERERPGIIHAASNFQNALPALKLGKKIGIKTIYEVRGMWHHTQSSKIKGFQNSDRFNLQERQELLCCKIADEVFCISESLKKYLIKHGINASKITVIPNGVDSTAISPIAKDKDITRKYGLDKHHVLGFIGSITSYEGLDLVIEAISDLNARMDIDKKFKLLIVGNGQYRSHLQSLTEKLNLQEYVIFIGRVSHEEIPKYYSVIDVAPFARTGDLVCRLVTPLKTYEAMAMAKKVVVSDVGALQEMVVKDETGQVFEAGNLEDLKASILNIIDNNDVGNNARRWVAAERDWSLIISKVTNIYNRYNDLPKYLN